MATVFHLRWLQIAAALGLSLTWVWARIRARRAPGTVASPDALARAELWARRHYAVLLLILSGSFFFLAAVAKFSQFRALELSGQDFWLFVDMIAQMLDGGFFLTRFAPQAAGWVQHGAVHPMLSWALIAPLAWVTGPVHAALLFGPLVTTGAGALLATLVRPRGGAILALGLASAFLGSSLVGRILMYEVHPESAYPLLCFFWAWSAGFGDGRMRPARLIAATCLLIGLKEDAFLVQIPLLLLAARMHPTPRARAWVGLAAACAVGMMLLEFHAVSQWASGAWGPREWRGEPVVLPGGAGLLKGRHWDSFATGTAIARQIVEERGGLPAVLSAFGRFVVSRNLLGLLALAPWVVGQGGFWVAALPLLGALSLLDGPNRFLTYYSAPLLGPFWLAAAGVLPGTRFPGRWRGGALAWTVLLSLVLGGSGIELFRPTPRLERLRHEARDLARCLPSSGVGVVSSRFLSFVPLKRVWSDRIPKDNSGAVDFYFLAPELPSYELSRPQSEALLSQLEKLPHWTALDRNCRPLPQGSQAGSESEPTAVMLFVKR